MLMPTVFHENLFDDFFDPFWNDAALERMMNREARDTFGDDLALIHLEGDVLDGVDVGKRV